jgi:hypothetical protein
MKRRFLLAASALGLSTTGTRAQRSGRVWRIGYLSGNSPPDPTMASFRLGMQRVGRTEGRDYEIFARFADFQYERFPALIDELLADKVDIIITLELRPERRHLQRSLCPSYSASLAILLRPALFNLCLTPAETLQACRPWLWNWRARG